MAVQKLSSVEAIALLRDQPQAVYLDVRSVPEYESGHAPGAYNIPLMHMGPAGMSPNRHFEAEVMAAFAKDTVLVVACKAGGRSARAAMVLERLGFERIHDAIGGFSGGNDDPGWAQSGGPVTAEREPGRHHEDLAQ